MRLVDADLGGVRLVATRCPPIWLSPLLGGVALVALVAVGMFAVFPGVPAAPPPPIAVSSTVPGWDRGVARLPTAPTLREVYLARRSHHLSSRLPTAFGIPPDPPGPLPEPWRSVVRTAEEARLVAESLQDRAPSDVTWPVRDPVLGHLLDAHRGDPTVTAIGLARVPQVDPDAWPDRSEVPLADLIATGDVVLIGDRPALGQASERPLVEGLAARDALLYDDVRTRARALAWAVASAREVAVRGGRLTAHRQRRLAQLRHGIDTLLLGIGTVGGLAVSGAILALWLRQRTAEIRVGPHALTLARRRLLWEEIGDLCFREDGIRAIAQGCPVEIRAHLGPEWARVLHRVCWPLWARPEGVDDSNSRNALEQILLHARTP